MSQRFQRRPEDFRCEHCGTAVHGDGYTNHCPACLWSKHVDVTPGDRSEPCGGLMEPTEVELSHDYFFVRHCCQVCGYTNTTRAAGGDNHDALINVAREAAHRRSYGGDR